MPGQGVGADYLRAVRRRLKSDSKHECHGRKALSALGADVEKTHHPEHPDRGARPPPRAARQGGALVLASTALVAPGLWAAGGDPHFATSRRPDVRRVARRLRAL